MKKFVKIGYALLLAMGASMLVIGCGGGAEEEADTKPAANLDGLPKVPDDAAAMGDGPGGGKK